MRLLRSLRVRIVLLVVIAGVVPLGIVGYWITGNAARAGERLVRVRLLETLDDATSELALRWIAIRSELLTIADSAPVQDLLAGRGGEPDVSLPPAVQRMTVRNETGDEVALYSPVEGILPPGITERIPVFAANTTDRVGSLEVSISVNGLVADSPDRASALGSVVAAVERETGASLLPLPFSSDLLDTSTFQWAGEEWISERRPLAEPFVVLVAAAPITPITKPFEAAAQKGLLWLLIIAVGSMIAAVVLTGRITASLRRLASAASAVSRGDLSRRVESVGQDEVGQVASAFNLMTESLRRTMRELADRQALAAVGEFAASLSHEIRNALTAIRLDLQVAGESLGNDHPGSEPHERALAEVGRLDETVTAALELARSGEIRMEPFNLWDALQAAAHSARPELDAAGITLEVPEARSSMILPGDAVGLEQVFLNVLLNAAQATPKGGRVAIRVEFVRELVRITISDTGPGIPDELVDRVFEPFYSTRDDGTGLGLPIARRIVRAHGGRLVLESNAPTGTTVIVEMPLAGL